MNAVATNTGKYLALLLVVLVGANSGVNAQQAVPDGKIGVMIDLREKDHGVKTVWIKEVVPDGPAAKAGLQADDELYTIDGSGTGNMGLERAVEKLNGGPGTTVAICYHRAGNPIVCVDVVRAGNKASASVAVEAPANKANAANNIGDWLARVLTSYQGDLSDIVGSRVNSKGGGASFNINIPSTLFSRQSMMYIKEVANVFGEFQDKGFEAYQKIVAEVERANLTGVLPATYRASPQKEGEKIITYWLPEKVNAGQSEKAMKVRFYIGYVPGSKAIVVCVTAVE